MVPSEGKTVDVYATFWSDTALNFMPKPLFPVSAGDTLSASLTVANKMDARHHGQQVGRKMRFSIGAGTRAAFDQAEWTQEDPGNPDNHARYPELVAPVFHHLTVNSTALAPADAALYSQWMSVNHSTVAPTVVHDEAPPCI